MKLFFTKRLLVIFSLILFLISSAVKSQNLVAGYYPDWLKTTLPAQSIKFEHLTHIVHAFAWPQSSGGVSYYGGMFNYNLAEATHNAGKKILLALGGWGQSDGFAPMSADSAMRAKFIDNIVALIFDKNYDGIDLDWEFPTNITEGKNLTRLVKELREKFNQENPDWLITMAVSSGSYSGQYFEYSELANYIDWFGMMGYDFHGSWTAHAGHNAPLYQPSNCSDGCSDNSIVYLSVERQVPKQKLLLGLPFYGKEFTSNGLYQPILGNVTDILYSDVYPRITSSSWEYYWDDFSKVPYLLSSDHTKFITYDDTMSIGYKCRYALDNQLAGMMIWALGQDLISGSQQPLLEKIGREMGLVTSLDNSHQEIISDFQLFDNYPNPFNPSTKIKFQIPSSPPLAKGEIPIHRDGGFITLKVYDILGREVAALVDEEKPAGTYEATFDGSDLSSGLYIYTLSSGNFIQSKKMLLLK
jgi:chitinase